MNNLVQRYKGILGGLAILGIIAWGSQSLILPQASGSMNTAQVEPSASPSQSMRNGLIAVAKAVTPAVVNITRAPRNMVQEGHAFPKEFRGPRNWPDWMEKFFEFHDAPPFPRGPEGPRSPWAPRGQTEGSGVIVSSDGYIVTNNHVVEGVKEVTVTLPDTSEYTGTIIGTDPKTDLAVVKIDAKDLPAIPWGDASKLQVGETVLAVGNPFGLTSTVTQGIVSALGRGRMGITQYEDFIQTDAAINPGNSGGALVNRKGELVGINTAIVSRTGGYQGIGFAVPTTMAKPVYESLAKTGKVVRGYLGIGIQDVTKDLAASFHLKEAKGALVGDVKKDKPADQGGLQPGDVIIRYRSALVANPVALQRMVTKTPIGTQATMTVVRDGKEMEITVKIGNQPDAVTIARVDQDQPDHAVAGLAVRELNGKTARTCGLAKETQGVVVVDIEPGSEADRAGVVRGDVIREINREPITSLKDFEAIASELKKDERILMLITRRGSSVFVSVKV